MSVQNVVLGQIIRRRGYGYELADRLREWSEALELSESAIYAALRSLETKGLIVEVGDDTPEQDRRRSNVRVIYEATPEGQSYFQQWMAAVPKKRPLREELHMQLMVAEDDDIPALVEGLRQMEEDCRTDLARIIGCSFDPQRSAHARISSFGAPLVQDGLISHLQTTMEWAQRSRSALRNRLDGGSTGVPGRQRP
ncbi:MAG TPA: PadR family transcriptional regulator [Thermoleophilaceae bacterium]